MGVIQDLDLLRGSLGRVGLVVAGLLAILALGFATTSTASAKEQVGFFVAGEESEEEAEQPRFEAETSPAFFEGGGSDHVWGFQIGNLECPVDFSGELSSAASDLTLVPFVSYFACNTPGGMTLTINSNGCVDTVDLLNSGPPYIGEFGISCPSESPYQFNLGGLCTISIPAQTGLAQVDLENTGEGAERAVHAAIDAEGLKYTISGLKFLCENGEYENGTYSGTATLKGFDEQW